MEGDEIIACIVGIILAVIITFSLAYSWDWFGPYYTYLICLD